MSMLSQEEAFRPRFGWGLVVFLTALCGICYMTCTDPIATGRSRRNILGQPEIYDVVEDRKVDERPLFIGLWLVAAVPLGLWSARLTWLKRHFPSATLTYAGDVLAGGVITGTISIDCERPPSKPIELTLAVTRHGSDHIFVLEKTMIQPDGRDLPFTLALPPPDFGPRDWFDVRFKAREGDFGWAADFTEEIDRR